MQPQTKVPACALVFAALLCAASVVLSALLVNAGRNEGMLQDVYIAKMNMSNFGQDLVPTLIDKITSDSSWIENWAHLNSGSDDKKKFKVRSPASSSKSKSTTKKTKRFDLGDAEDFLDDAGDGVADAWDNLSDAFGDIWDDLSDYAKELATDVVGTLDDIADGLVDNMADALGIPEYFALHMLDVCYVEAGETKQDLTCSDPEVGYGLDLDGYLDSSLSIAGFKIPLADFLGADVYEKLQDASDAISGAFMAICILYIIVACCSGILVLQSAYFAFLSLKWQHTPKYIKLTGMVFAIAALLCVFAGSIIITIIAKIANDAMGDARDVLNIQVERSDKFVGMTWACSACLFLATGIWIWAWLRTRRSKMAGSGKETHDEYEMDDHHHRHQRD
ncbi:SUR7 family protein pun1 [Zalerion maritima]|uniref:SUR7 family protein pun1 n=1 Tax=Zalerion maritima TaxID=339359 RepID=A0AAD5RYG2_9PEZI|nr:SUR7 family protein pun1 [Zalerion maritima]